MTTAHKLPIKCSSFRATINGTRYRIWSDGSVSLSLTPDQIKAMETPIERVFTLADLISFESKSARLDPHSEEGTLRLRRNKLTREANQARLWT